MQILGILTPFFVDLVAGVYRLVARVYDLMLDFVTQTGALYGESLLSFAQTCYILAGVFMLFRIVISMIQMIINPDLVSDKSAGAGKLVARVVVSIILLIVLSPQGILFAPNTGLLPRIENALLNDKDGLIYNLISQTVGEERKLSNPSDIIVEDVYADNLTTCYYFEITKRANNGSNINPGNIVDVNHFYKITFSKKKNNEGKTYTKIKNSDWYFYSAESKYKVGGGSVTKSNGDPIYYTELKKLKVLSGSSKDHKYTNKSDFNSCPSTIIDDYPRTGTVPAGASDDTSGSKKKYPEIYETPGMYGGSSTLKGMLDIAKKYMESNGRDNILKYNSIAEDLDQSESTVGQNHDFLRNVRPASVSFAQNVASCFQECTIDQNECKDVQSKMFKTSDGDKELADKMDGGGIEFSWIMSMLVGMALIVYILILCVDVIVRRFKLLLLQILAPIPAISYVDPKDKIFNQWAKYYGATYLDLFIKLIAISFAVGLLNEVMNAMGESDNLLQSFFYIVAILVFAKIVPSMISKIFGLDGLGGSFKDIMGMAKGAAGFGAGAVLGGAVGAATGKGLGRVSGFAKGALQGAGAGAKGNVFGGTRNIAAHNARINDAKANGLGFWDRATAGIAGAVGYSPKTQMDNKIKSAVDKKEMLDNFRKHKDNIESMAESSNYLSDLKTKLANNEIGKEQYKAARKRFIEINEKGRKNANGFYEIQDDNGNWQVARIGVDGLDDGPIKFESGAQGKIMHAEDIMRDSFASSHSLQQELGMQGQTIANFEAFENAESKAKDKSNIYEREIIKVQGSDEYGKAQAYEDFSKKSS